MENVKLACSEVYCILEILGDSYKNKLPKKFLEFINLNRNTEFSLEINENEYQNLNISKDGLVLISFLNLKYWVDDENEKQRLIDIYKKNEEKKQENLNRYKQVDWLKQTNNLENEDNKKEEQTTELIEVKKFSFFDKIKSIIKNIFNKKKE